jgi:mRNA-degrading endonuclease toxin of MazEF toxin-antitoxin module
LGKKRSTVGWFESEFRPASSEQVRPVAVERIGPRLGVLPAPVMAELDQALRLHLAL